MRGNASSPVRRYGVGLTLPGSGFAGGRQRGLSSLESNFFILLRCQIPPSGARPFLPTSAQRHSYLGPKIGSRTMLLFPL